MEPPLTPAGGQRVKTPPLPSGASFAPLFNQSLHGFAVVDGAGRYVWCSDSLCLLLGVEKDTLLGCAASTLCAAAGFPCAAARKPRCAYLIGVTARDCAQRDAPATRGARARGCSRRALRAVACADGAILAAHAAVRVLVRRSPRARARARARPCLRLRLRRRCPSPWSVCEALDKPLRRRSVADLVLPDDRHALATQLGGATADAAATPAVLCPSADTFVRVRHAARDGSQPVELKACADGTYVYCTLLDARMPARLEKLLPDFLLTTSHDLRTPCCSIQSASSLLASLPAVAADTEACQLLSAIDSACAVLLRVTSNMLRLRQLQRDGLLQLQPAVAVDPSAAVRRAVAVVCSFLGDPPRVAWADTLLPSRVLVDPDALEACLQNVLLATVRFGAWLPSHNVVRLRVAAEPLQPAMQLEVSTGLASPRATEASANAFVLLINAETPGRSLTRDECDRMMSPCGMAPADKVRAHTLPLARNTAASLTRAHRAPGRRVAGQALRCMWRAAWRARWAASLSCMGSERRARW